MVNFRDRLKTIKNMKAEIVEKHEQEQAQAPKLKDDRFYTIQSKKKNIPETLHNEKSIVYKFIIIPFKEGQSYLPFHQYNMEYDFATNTTIRNSRPILDNFVTNKYMKKPSGYFRHKYFEHLMFYGSSRTEDINDPLKLYDDYRFNNNLKDLKFLVPDKIEKIMQILVVHDPLANEESDATGKIKLINMKQSLLNSIVNYDEKVEKILDQMDDENSPEGNKLVDKIEKLVKLELNTETPNFTLNSPIKITLRVPVMENNASAVDMKEVYSNVTLDFITKEEVEEMVNLDERYSLEEIIIEQKDRYVNKILAKNLKDMGWETPRIFEYQAFADLYGFVKNDQSKLKIFNEINKYVLDINLFTQENYRPKRSLLLKRGVEDIEVQVKDEPEEIVVSQTPTKTTETTKIQHTPEELKINEISSEYEIDLDDDIPF